MSNDAALRALDQLSGVALNATMVYVNGAARGLTFPEHQSLLQSKLAIEAALTPKPTKEPNSDNAA